MDKLEQIYEDMMKKRVEEDKVYESLEGFMKHAMKKFQNIKDQDDFDNKNLLKLMDIITKLLLKDGSEEAKLLASMFEQMKKDLSN